MKFHKWDITEELKTEEDIKYYLEAAYDDGDPELIAAVLGDVARVRGITNVAKKTKVKALLKTTKMKQSA